MLSLRVRPRIVRYTNSTVDEVMESFYHALESKEFNLEPTLLKNHVLVKIPDEIHHYWSPELQLEVNDNYMKDDENYHHQENTVIRGFVGPKSTVWTLFIFLYVVFGGLALFGIVLGSSQQMLNHAGSGYLYTILGGLGLVSTFAATLIGQKMGEEQTNLLVNLTKKAFENC
jgi:hypothetical protein